MPISKRIKSSFFFGGIRFLRRVESNLVDLRDLLIISRRDSSMRTHPNPLTRFGKQSFSQSEEDGITLEILSRIGKLQGGTFAEYGVGTGMENNTLVLRAMGWKGFWVGNENLAFEINCPEDSFKYIKSWITLENIVQISESAKAGLGGSEIDVISVDLDGNDLFLVENLLEGGFLPKLFIVEYNSKYFPPVEWSIIYDPEHEWAGDDYFGASLMSFSVLFSKYKYKLVCCNSHTGANAFFVRDEYSSLFKDVPHDIRDIFAKGSSLLPSKPGHKTSIRAIANLFS
jgi:hypothetical protein